MTLSPTQVKAARELLGWTQTDLAKRVHLRTRAIAQFENGERRLPFFDLELIKGILEAAGVELGGEGRVGDTGKPTKKQ